MIRNVNKEHKAKLNTLNKMTIFITKVVGTMWCAIAFFDYYTAQKLANALGVSADKLLK